MATKRTAMYVIELTLVGSATVNDGRRYLKEAAENYGVSREEVFGSRVRVRTLTEFNSACWRETKKELL